MVTYGSDMSTAGCNSLSLVLFFFVSLSGLRTAGFVPSKAAKEVRDLKKPMTSCNVRDEGLLNILTDVCRSGVAEPFPGQQEAVPQTRQQHRVFLEILCVKHPKTTHALTFQHSCTNSVGLMHEMNKKHVYVCRINSGSFLCTYLYKL